MKILITILASVLTFASLAQSSEMHAVEKYMDAHASINNFEGTVLVARNDTVLVKKAYGYAHREWKVKHDVDSKFSLASVSKQFAAIAILQLAEEGKLSLSDTLSMYYPDFSETGKITIEMLLSHNSGITDNGKLHDTNTRFTSDSIVSFILSQPLIFEPGTETVYSNIGYNLLSIIVEKITGQSYGSYLRENVFAKIGMKNSGVSSDDSVIHKMSSIYYHGEPSHSGLVKNPYINWHHNQGHDGVFSTVEDLYLYSQHLMDSTTLLSEKSKTKMFTSYNDQDMGYGVFIDPWYSHGHHMIGHDGGYFGTITSFHIYPDDDVFVAVLSNNQSPSHLLAYGLSAIALGLPVEMPYEHEEVKIDPSIMSDYAGDYEGVRIHLESDTLYYADFALIPESESKFFRKIDNDRTVEFIRNEDGVVVRMVATTGGVRQVRVKE